MITNYELTFIFTEIKDASLRQRALHDLIALLPVANRDTLWVLLHFLSLVVQHSTDVIDDHGNQVNITMEIRFLWL